METDNFILKFNTVIYIYYSKTRKVCEEISIRFIVFIGDSNRKICNVNTVRLAILKVIYIKRNIKISHRLAFLILS
jgi:hypothetical protein